jgi:endonuclease/exonuclease/phosphatase family metal-dependent hydrolase
MGRRRGAIVALATVLVVGGAACDGTDQPAELSAELDAEGRRIELGPTELKVMTFNVWLGGNLVDIGKVAEAIEASGADVVGLQESDGNARTIADLVGWAHVDEQLQIISRYPLIAPPMADGYLYVQLAPGQVVAMANIHLPADDYGPYLVRDGSDVDDVVATEIETRVGAFETLAAGWQSAFDAGIPLLLTGDFNTPSHRDWTDDTVGDREHMRYAVDWPVSHAVEELGFVDTYRDVHDDAHEHPGITWTLGYPYPRINDDEAVDRIDFVYAAGVEDVVASEIVGPRGIGDVTIGVDPYPSDHLGVVSTLTVDPVEPPVYVAASTPRTEVGDPIGFHYHAPGGFDTDRIVIVPAGGDPESEGLASLDPAEASYFGRITLGTGGLRPGEYEAVLTTSSDDGAVEEVSRSRFWLVERGAVPNLTVASGSVAAGEPIEVTWTDAYARKFDWLAIYSAADPDLYGYWAYAYTDASVDGSYTFGPDDLGEEMLPPGDYVVRLLSDDSYITLAEASLTVT